MAETATLARPYAQAAFRLAKEARTLDRWSRALRLLAGAALHPRVQALLGDPEVTDAQKIERLATLGGEEIDSKARNFLHVLADNKRLALLPDISRQFETLRAEEEKTLDVEVISAYELSEAEQARITQSLKQRFGREVDLKTRIDRDLLGGALIRAGDTVIDGSVRGRLDKLSETLVRV